MFKSTLIVANLIVIVLFASVIDETQAGVRNEKNVAKFCSQDNGKEIVKVLIKCEQDILPDYVKVGQDCFIESFDMSEDDTKDHEKIHGAFCADGAAAKRATFKICLKAKEEAAGLDVLDGLAFWNKIKPCVIANLPETEDDDED